MSNLYRYRCTYCEVEELLVAAFWEDEATCVECGEMMFRLTDPFSLALVKTLEAPE